MTFFDELGLKAAERLEASVGPWVALASYRRLLDAEPSVRAVAALGVLRCGVALGDDEAVALALPAWRSATRLGGGALSLVRTLVAAKKADLAARLAAAEAERRPRAQAEYALALARDAALPGSDLDAWERAARAARGEGALDLFAASVGWFAARAFEGAAAGVRLSRGTLADFGTTVEPARVPFPLRVHAARAALASPRRFKRAAALATLSEIARTASEPTRTLALRAIAAHADAMGSRLDPVEVDRVQAALGAAPVATTDTTAAPPIAIDLAVEAARIAPDHPPSPTAWIEAVTALGSSDGALRGAGQALLCAGLERSLGVPPFPWTECAQALAATGFDAIPFLEEAVRWGEPAGCAHLGDARRSRALVLHQRGDRAGALAELLAARRAFSEVGQPPA